MGRSSRDSGQLNLSNRRVARLRAAFWAVESALLTRTVGRRRTFGFSHPPRSDAQAGTSHDGGGARPAHDEADRARVLRWEFSRGAEQLTCELALSDDDTYYEMRTMTAATRANESVERFTDAAAAFERQSALEGSLLVDGWTLERYESIVVERQQRSIAV